LDKYREEVTVLTNAIYSPYCIWGVPDYVPETVVQTIQDLLKPDVAAKMRKQIQGINPGAGISRFSKVIGLISLYITHRKRRVANQSQEIIDKYGLTEAGYSFQHGSQADCFETFEAAYENSGESAAICAQPIMESPLLTLQNGWWFLSGIPNICTKNTRYAVWKSRMACCVVSTTPRFAYTIQREPNSLTRHLPYCSASPSVMRPSRSWTGIAAKMA
jgi:hypothetical protein